MTESKSQIFRFDDVEVREREFTLVKAGQVLTVEPKAFRALLFLLHNPQRLISKEELLNSVWGEAAVTEGSLTRCIWLLRTLLGDDIRKPHFIETVPTVGYRWVCKLEVSEEDSEESVPTKEPDGPDGAGKTAESRRRLWGWAIFGGGVLVLCLAAAIWYLRRPLPPPRITGYTQITHDGHHKTLVGTDGNRLYFNQAGPLSVAQVAISGGEIAQIPVAVPNPRLVDVSPDGSSSLVIPQQGNYTLGPLWNVRILGGSARRLGDAYAAAFSPDGNSVVYSAVDGVNWGGIYLVQSDGTGAHKIAAVSQDADGLAWSPEGSIIRFTADDRIWEVSSNGSNLHEFLAGWRPSEEKCCGRWTPDGRFFLFLVKNQIWAIDERRGLFRRTPSVPVQLTTGPMLWGTPIPSKDGSKVFAQGVTPDGELSRFDSRSKQFLPFLGGISAQGVVFSNDGKSIAYVSYPEGILWKADRDGSNPVQLSDPPMDAFLPRWSPDGSLIAFTAFAPGRDNEIYVASAAGGSPQKLSPEDNVADAFPSWSPDGHKIVFQSASGDGKPPCRILDLDSRQVTTVPGSEGLFGFLWSPDGRYLLAGTADGLHIEIFDFKTQQWSELAQKGPVDSGQWSHDSQFIYFKRVTGDTGVFRISIKGGAAEKIADLKDWHDAGWFGAWMGLDPTDAPLLLRDIARADIYALTLEEK